MEIMKYSAWDLSQGSKLPKKGDKVRVIPELYRELREENYRMIRRALPENHPFVAGMKAPDGILKRAEAGEVATITKAENSRSKNGEAHLKFEDGFECGASFGILSKAED